MKRTEKREHLIDVAASLFNRLGYHAAGIDLVIAEAGIAKTTLYRHFNSKEELIVAVLKRVDAQFRDKMRATVESSGNNKGDKLLATFDFLEAWFKQENFHGCPFISAAGEFGDQPSVVFHEAAIHKRLIVAYLEELARADGLPEPRKMAEEINLLHEGATAVAHITGDPTVARKAKNVAERLIRQAQAA
ncbi:MAG TPA: TetR/AcrR family transcriptional regulator [Afifellaceae bacterium]|nr:TetR/AcrR family transcriptional regulator [Afifellaceae bacterium]